MQSNSFYTSSSDLVFANKSKPVDLSDIDSDNENPDFDIEAISCRFGADGISDIENEPESSKKSTPQIEAKSERAKIKRDSTQPDSLSVEPVHKPLPGRNNKIRNAKQKSRLNSTRAVSMASVPKKVNSRKGSKPTLDESHDLTASDSNSVLQGAPVSKKAKRNTEMIWKSGDFPLKFHEFQADGSGITDFVRLQLSNTPTLLEAFLSQFPESLAKTVVDETNKYYRYCNTTPEPSPGSHVQAWKELTVGEFYLFLGVTMLMTQVKKHSIYEYWSTDPLLSTPEFAKRMTRDRYILILRYIHFNDNTSQPDGDQEYKIRPIVDQLNSIFEQSFVPFQNLCIDESLVLFKGRLSFKQFIPSKRHRFGIKLFLLCDAETGYILRIVVYVGSKTRVSTVDDGRLGTSGDIVMELMHKYTGLGHTLFVDNWYTGVPLFQYLHARNTNCCGTIRPRRQFIEKRPKKLQPGELISKNNGIVNHISWMDKQLVHMLSTFHTDSIIPTDKISYQTGLPVIKPRVVVDYNSDMGAVDKSDMMISYVECVRKSAKWYRKLVFHLLDLSLLNSYYVWQVTTGEKQGLPIFQREMCRQIFAKFGETKLARQAPKVWDLEERFSGRHFPSKIPKPRPQDRQPVKKCKVCSQRRDVTSFCKICNVGLCWDSCFEVYHTHPK